MGHSNPMMDHPYLWTVIYTIVDQLALQSTDRQISLLNIAITGQCYWTSPSLDSEILLWTLATTYQRQNSARRHPRWTVQDFQLRKTCDSQDRSNGNPSSFISHYQHLTTLIMDRIPLWFYLNWEWDEISPERLFFILKSTSHFSSNFL